jgi:hypothetical protein
MAAAVVCTDQLQLTDLIPTAVFSHGVRRSSQLNLDNRTTELLLCQTTLSVRLWFDKA